MKNTKVGFLLAAATLGASMSAFGGAGVIITKVEPLQPNVTYSTVGPPPLNTYIGYEITVSNSGPNTVNHIRFTGASSTTDTDEKAVFSSVEGATCSTTNADKTAIECIIGTLRAGASAPTFAVFFKTPEKDTTTPLLPDGISGSCSTTDCARFSGVTYFAENTVGAPQPSPASSAVAWPDAPATTEVALGTSNPTVVKSGVPKSGGTLFTGAGGVSTGGDRFATLVKVPEIALYTKATITESLYSVDCFNFFTCDQVAISIPFPDGVVAYLPYLEIFLRVDRANIRPGTKIGSVVLQYVDDADLVHTIGPCASPTTPRSDHLPCIAESKYYKNRSVPGWTAELDGDFEWRVLNLGNGGYRIPG